MLRKIKNWFSKNPYDYELQPHLPKDEDAKFILKIDNINIGILSSKNGDWFFSYTDEFKRNTNDYNLIVGFPDINKVYQSESLWPFFQIRIPGLKQPAVQKILKEEMIDQSNEAELLKRFGKKTISNSYRLEMF